MNNADSNIIASYLFGSYATGKATKLSDIDIAVLLDETMDRKNYLNMKLLLLANLSSCLGTEKIDVVILNEATPDLAYNVIKDGVLLFERQGSKGQQVTFKARTFDRYFDYLPVKKMFSEVLSTRIREGRYGG
jgi:hypothetical protein